MDGEPSDLLLVVVGAHLRAEAEDRPLASLLCDQIRSWQAMEDDLLDPVQVTTCTDLWYLNQQELMLHPTIAIGDPEVNATTAFLANRLPTAFVVEDSFRIQLDPELVELRACIWGVSAEATAGALDVFAERYLDAFLRSAHDLAPPR